MIGTICTIKNFLNNEDCKINLKINGNRQELVNFAKERIIEIPKYQREIRWDLQNTNQLLSDLSKEDKFLGNIFLSEGNKSSYEIIDGQQRLTVLYIIITILSKEYSEYTNDFKGFSLVNLYNPTFINFYDIDRFESTEDPYRQKTRFEEIHKCIRDYFSKQNDEDIILFCKNLVNSKINIILLENEEKKDAIDGFIDINIKGVKLDSEDILKGYIFKKTGNDDDIKEKWIGLKTIYFDFCNKGGNIKITDLLYNVIFCVLKNDPDLCNIKHANVDKDFLLSEKIIVKDEYRIREYEKGTHIMELIHKASIIEKILKNTNDVIVMNIKFLDNSITENNPEFLSSFGLQGINSTVRCVYFNMVNMLLRNNVSIYKFFITYCYISCVNKYINEEKTGEKLIYYSYFCSFLFDSLSSRKGLNSVAKEIQGVNEYTNNLLSMAKSLLQNDIEPKLNFTQKLFMPEAYFKKAETNAKYTVFQFAILFECFKFDPIGMKLNFKTDKFMHIFNLSNEHFIVNNSGKYLENNVEKKYTDELFRKRNIFINLIPLEENLNGEIGNKCIQDKIKIIRNKEKEDKDFWKKNGSKYSCEYLKIVENFCEKYDGSVLKVFENSNLILDEVYRKFKERILGNQ